MKWFITFGGPTANYHNAVKRICNQASILGVFDHIIGYTDKDLKDDTTFWNKHQNFIETNAAKGYGYWLWKSYLTKKTLEKMAENDILVYADAGCVINPHGKPRLLEYFDIVNQSPHGNFSFQMEHLEKCWTKKSVFDYCEANNDPNITETGQLVGGIYVIRKSTLTTELIDQWYHCCCQYHIVDDSVDANVKANHVAFRENRHDQSIFSVLRKKHGTVMSKTDETWFAPDWNSRGRDYPFWAIRMKY
jgi:hypothetical protein